MTLSSASAAYSGMSCPPMLLASQVVNATTPHVVGKRIMRANLNFLVVDVGGTHIEIVAVKLCPSRFLDTKKVRL
jgi:hypothetical protein